MVPRRDDGAPLNGVFVNPEKPSLATPNNPSFGFAMTLYSKN
jgi:hypothetical protein